MALRPSCSICASGLLQAVGAAGGHGHVGAGLGQGLREGHTQSRRGAGHQRHLAVQPETIENAHGASLPGHPSRSRSSCARSRSRSRTTLGYSPTWIFTRVTSCAMNRFMSARW